MKENVHFSVRNTGVPPRRALQNEHFPPKKLRNAETTKMDHLGMQTFPQRKLGNRPRMCGFLGARVPFQNVPYSLANWRSRQGGSVFLQARSKLSQNVHYSLGKKGSHPEEHPRATCERLASDLNLENRDEYLSRKRCELFQNVQYSIGKMGAARTNTRE